MSLHLDNRVTEALSENDYQNGSQVYNETEIFDLDSDADIPADASNISIDDIEIPIEITRNQHEASLFAEFDCGSIFIPFKVPFISELSFSFKSNFPREEVIESRNLTCTVRAACFLPHSRFLS